MSLFTYCSSSLQQTRPLDIRLNKTDSCLFIETIDGLGQVDSTFEWRILVNNRQEEVTILTSFFFHFQNKFTSDTPKAHLSLTPTSDDLRDKEHWSFY